MDVMFAADALPSGDTLIDALGGEDVAKARQLFDPDANDPRMVLPTVFFLMAGLGQVVGFILGFTSLFFRDRKKLFGILAMFFSGLPLAVVFLLMLIGLAAGGA